MEGPEACCSSRGKVNVLETRGSGFRSQKLITLASSLLNNLASISEYHSNQWS